MIWDCVIVGGGPAGCAAAVHLSRKGRRVALIERASFPRRKACGEGILPAGVEALKELGVHEAAAAVGRVFRGVSYTTREGREARSPFPRGEGLAVPRETLDQLLLRRAAAAPGVRVYESREAVGVERLDEGVLVRLPDGALRARRLIAADGIASSALKALGIARRAPERPRYGLAARLNGIIAVGDFVEVFLLGGGELYLTPLPGEGRATVALLLERSALTEAARGREADFLHRARAHPTLHARLKQAAFDAPVIGLGPLGTAPSCCEEGPWLAAGDAAGSVDPLVGDGVGLALRGARLAAEETDAALGGAGRPGRYSRRRAVMVRPKARLARLALALSRRPGLARIAIFVLRLFPSAFSSLLAD